MLTLELDSTVDCILHALTGIMKTLDPVSYNSNEECIVDFARHTCTDMTLQERANSLFQNKEILAPMVRASSTPLRCLALSYGCDLVYTEEIVDRAITSTERIYNEKLKTIDYHKKMESFSSKVQRRMEKNKDPPPTVLRIDPEVERGKLIYQMGTGESNLALPAALMVQKDVDGLDINMGCPKKFSVSGGMGSALLEDLPRACDIISTLRRNLSIPVSCKIRLLKDDRSTVDFVTALVKAGANAVAIHGREPGDESQKSAKLDRLTNVVKLLKSSSSSVGVPIIINGDLYTRNEMVNRRRETGADAIMLARPALYNTSIFIKPSPPPTSSSGTCDFTKEDTTQAETRYGFDSELLLSKTRVVQDYLGYAVKYHGHVKNIKYVVCEMMTNRRTPTNLTHYMPIRFDGGQTISDVCACKTMESLCKLWDVSLSESTMWKDGKDDEAVAGDLHRYDDGYFLDPKGFMQKQNQASCEGGKDNDGGIQQGSNHDDEDDHPRLLKKSKVEAVKDVNPC